MTLPPLPAGVEHANWCDGDKLNMQHAWKHHCPACMFRYGFRDGVLAARGQLLTRKGAPVTIGDSVDDVVVGKRWT